MTLTLRQAVRASEHRLPQASYRDGGQQTFWHVGYNDADEEDDGLKPGVFKDRSFMLSKARYINYKTAICRVKVC